MLSALFLPKDQTRRSAPPLSPAFSVPLSPSSHLPLIPTPRLFLVHSECSESAYINSRPFRVNAGPVSGMLFMW